MDSLDRLHLTLKTAAYLLDNAAGQIRDVALSPSKQHIHDIAEALTIIFEIQGAIYKQKPELKPVYEEPSQEVIAANRRLGDVLISAYELVESGKLDDAISLLAQYQNSETVSFHAELSASEKERLINLRSG